MRWFRARPAGSARRAVLGPDLTRLDDHDRMPVEGAGESREERRRAALHEDLAEWRWMELEMDMGAPVSGV